MKRIVIGIVIVLMVTIVQAGHTQVRDGSFSVTL